MSTPLILVDELCVMAEQELKDMLLEVELPQNNHPNDKPLESESQGIAPRAPSIIPGFLDDDEPKAGKQDDISKSIPFVIVRYLNGEETENQGTATVKFIATTYSQHGQGWRDPLNVLERLRQAILRKRIIASRFEIQFPFKIDAPEDRPWPYWVAWMTTTWSVGRPILTEYEEGMYGEGSL